MADIDQQLLADGYYTFTGSYPERAVGRFQKRVLDGKGKTKYFITIYKYRDIIEPNMFNYEADAQFNLRSGVTFNAQMLNVNHHTVPVINELFDNIWTKMECKYD